MTSSERKIVERIKELVLVGKTDPNSLLKLVDQIESGEITRPRARDGRKTVDMQLGHWECPPPRSVPSGAMNATSGDETSPARRGRRRGTLRVV
jgi:hypothetical protein